MPASAPGGLASQPPGEAQPPAAERREYTLDVRFTGSGSEYFRIWIVNLLLTLVTLTLYLPWAKARRLRYFHGNTLVDGHPLGFHGDPRKMFRGYLLLGALAILYSVAGEVSALSGLIALLLVAAIVPALLKSAMQFRLANTSWRGLRFRFEGSLVGAYRAWLPVFVPLLVLVGGFVGVTDEANPPLWYGFLVLGVVAAGLLVAPWLWWNLKRYQHGNYAFGSWRTELRASVASFYAVFLKTLGMLLLMVLCLGLIVAAAGLLGGLGLAGWRSGESGGARLLAIVVGVVIVVSVSVFLIQLVPRPYFVSRMQNLVWSRTGNRSMRFRSQLGFRPFLLLTLKNWILVLLTLGLYWPFAAIAIARMRLEAVSITSRVDPRLLVAHTRAIEGDATGEAAGDLFGLDIGL